MQCSEPKEVWPRHVSWEGGEAQYCGGTWVRRWPSSNGFARSPAVGAASEPESTSRAAGEYALPKFSKQRKSGSGGGVPAADGTRSALSGGVAPMMSPATLA